MKQANKTGSKAHTICRVLAQVNVPLTREEIMLRVHLAEHKLHTDFSPNSNNCYFLPRLSDRGFGSSYGAVSVIVKGLVRKCGTRKHRFLYELTDAGKALAAQG